MLKVRLHGSGALRRSKDLVEIEPRVWRRTRFHQIFILLACSCTSLGLHLWEAATSVAYPQYLSFVSPLLVEAEPAWKVFSACGLVKPLRSFIACGPGEPKSGGCSGKFSLAGVEFGAMQGADGLEQGMPQAAAGAAQVQFGPEDVDRLVKQRLEQAFSGVFRKLIDTSERAAQAAEASASISKVDALTKSLKVDQWKPGTREDELKTWKEWSFQFTNWLIANDRDYEEDFDNLDLDTPVDHDMISNAQEIRSQRLFGVLCNVLKGRPLLLVKQMAEKKNGLEAWRMLKREMEPREKARALAMVRQLASWKFDDKADLHSQLVRYEEALKTYEASSGKAFPEDLVLATVVTGLREPLKSQVQLQMTSTTRYSDVREWILRYESLNAPWSTSLGGKGCGAQESGGPQPMEIDVIKGKSKKGKGKGKDAKGKGKDNKGKDARSKKGKPGDGKGWQASGKRWDSWDGGQSWGSNLWGQSGQKGKSKKGLDPSVCALCGGKGHWKNECPQKGKGKVNQVVEQTDAVHQGNFSSATSTAASSLPSSASAMKAQAGYRVNRVETYECGTPRTCRVTELFDLTELDDDGYQGDFGLESAEVMVISCPDLPEFAPGVSTEGNDNMNYMGAETFSMDATDGDGNWTFDPSLGDTYPLSVLAVQARSEIVLDSGADISVAPLRLASLGTAAGRSGVVMQDAQGRRIPEVESRVLDIEVETLEGNSLLVREKFCIAPVKSIILSLGRLIRWGWALGTHGGRPVIERSGHRVPIRLRRNTLTILAMVASIAAGPQLTTGSPTNSNYSMTPRQVNMMTFDDLGRLPPEAEDLASNPGWHILPSGLPFFVAHYVEEIDLEQNLWNDGDWAWLAVFVRLEEAVRKPEPGDVWMQVMTTKVEDFERAPKLLKDLDSELDGRHDVAMVLHVEELAKDLLTNPRDIFAEPLDDNSGVPVPMADGPGGAGDFLEDAAMEGRELKEDNAEEEEEELEGVKLSVQTPLKDLKELCRKLGLSVSGGKSKVLRRLKLHYEVLEKQMTSELARKMFSEQEREPGLLKTPVLPSSRQQELHNVTHHPFQPWCEACVLGRSRQNPHRAQRDEPEGDELPDAKETNPVIQIDYGYTFTKLRGEIPDEEVNPADDQGPEQREQAETPKEPVDVRDQYGLCLLAAESTTGWICAVPVLEKGAGSLKRVAEQLVRLSLQVSPGGTVVVQCDTEPSAKQVVNAVSSCRGKLGLKTDVQWVPKGSHSSNGRVEKAIDTVRRNALTLKAFLEDRVEGKIEGHQHVYSWFFRHAAFLYNRFAVNPKGGTAFEILHGRKYKGALVPFGERVIFHRPSRHKGDLQWCRGIWLGVNERNGAHILGTEDGTFESRSVRRLPEEQKWDLESVLNMRGFPWSYLGKGRRRRPLYTSAKANVPLLPDTASLEELARAAGRAAAESIAAGAPKPNMDEAGSDPSSSSSSPSPSSSSRPAPSVPAEAPDGNQQQEQRHQQQLSEGPSSLSAPSRDRAQASVPMETSSSAGGPEASRPEPVGEANPKRPRLLLDRPRLDAPLASPTAAASPSTLYPPAFAGVKAVTGDMPEEELAGFSSWGPELCETLEEESELAGEYFEAMWDENAERPPELSEEELANVDAEADAVEIKRLLEMGVVRWPKEGENVEEYQSLTTKVVRDWRQRPGWIRRSRLVGREFKSLSPYTQELFAPASTLAATHGFMAVALSQGLELCTFDFKDAYLQVDQPVPMTIEVNAAMFGTGQQGAVTLVLDKLLPGQRIGASAWFSFAKDLLGRGSYVNYPKEPTLFKKSGHGSRASLVLHADDGLLASTKEERKELEELLSKKVKVEFSAPMVEAGDELQFLKRKYVRVEEGVAVFSNGRYLEALLKSLGAELKARDAPADASFLEPDNSKELDFKAAREYREAVGRLLYLSHTRPDVQFSVCILSSKMTSPTASSLRWLKRVVGYLAQTPEIGFMIHPIGNGKTFDFEGYGKLCVPNGAIIVESITDADWAGCRRTRRSRTSAQLYVGGSLVSSFVRSQRSVALSSGESEFVALVGGAAEAIYLADCIRFLVGGEYKVETRCRTDSAACKGISQRLGCGRVRHLQCGLLWVQQAVKDNVIAVSSIAGTSNPSDLGTKPLGGARIRELLFTMGAVLPNGQPYGQEDKQAADDKRAIAKLLKECKSDARASSVMKLGNLMPILLLMAQVQGGQGLSLAAPVVALWDLEAFDTAAVLVGVSLVTLGVFFGVPCSVLKLLKWGLSKFFPSTTTTCSQSTQTGDVKVVTQEQKESEERFMQEYVDRCTELRGLLAERRQEITQMQQALYQVRAENRQLRVRPVQRRVPAQISVATSRGERYHLPDCGNIRRSNNIQTFTPCQACLGG